jgi:hypothetical protein
MIVGSENRRIYFPLFGKNVNRLRSEGRILFHENADKKFRSANSDFNIRFTHLHFQPIKTNLTKLIIDIKLL